MTMQTQSDALLGPTYVGPQTTLDKGKGQAIEKSVPKKRSLKRTLDRKDKENPAGLRLGRSQLDRDPEGPDL